MTNPNEPIPLAIIMTYRITTLLFLVLMPFLGISQEADIEFLSRELCLKFQESDVNKSKTELFNYLQLKSNEVNKKFDHKVSSLKEEFKKTYPDKNDLEIAQIIGQNISLQAIEDCPVFMKISQKAALLDYDSSKQSITEVSKKVCGLMQENKLKNYDELNKLVDDKIFDIVLTEKRLIEKEYGQFGGKEFYDDLNAVLMTHCDIFFKMAMNNQKIKIGTDFTVFKEKNLSNSFDKSDGQINQSEFNQLLAKARVLISDFIHADYEALDKKLGIEKSEIEKRIGEYLTNPKNHFNEINQHKYITPVFRETDSKNHLELTIFACEILEKKESENFSRGNYYFVLISKISLNPEKEKIQFEDVKLLSEDLGIQKWWLGQYKNYMPETKKVMESFSYKMPPPPPPPLNLK